MKKIGSIVVACGLCIACKTIDLEDTLVYENDVGASSWEDEERQNEHALKDIYVQEELKVQDVEDTVVYIDRPVYVPAQKDVPELERKNLTGHDAVVESLKRATILPEQYKYGTFYYQFHDDLVYEIYAQPYHLTDIMLQPGEVLLDEVLLSEDEAVWELAANVSNDMRTGQRVQHLYIKPAYSKLDSSMIVTTDRRVYHFRIKSFADTHMAMVKFTYPNTRNVYATKEGATNAGRTTENDFIRVSNPEFLSFDYTVKRSLFKKPEFMPKRVYDDGQTTYIQVDEIVLHKKLPVIFNEKNEIVNYTVKKNVFVIPRLINKVTLRLGKEKVTVVKKKSKTKSEEHAEVSDE